MNVPVSAQLELVLLARILESIKSCPGLPIVQFFEELNVHLRKADDLSLSAYWKKVYPDDKTITSTVDVPKEEQLAGSGEDEQSMIVPNISELDHLRKVKHTEIRHDPLLVIRNLYENAMSSLPSASAEERTILLTACLLLGMKSGRASLLLHSTLLLYLFRNDCSAIDPKLMNDFWVKCKAISSKIKPSRVTPVSSDDGATRESTLLLSFGKADHGKLGLGDVTLNRSLPTVIDTLLYSEDVMKVASMSTYSLAINKVGSVYIWGTGGCVASLPASRVDSRPQLLDALPPKTIVVDISCGLGHALFLSQDGKIFSWGNGGHGRLGLGDLSDRTEACNVIFPTNEKFISVQCGASHSLALTAKGQVYSWGKNTQGQCGHGNNEDSLKPNLVKKLLDIEIVQLAAGWEHSLALSKDGKIYSWGSGYKDSRRGVIPPVLGLGHSESRPNPELISSLEGVKIKAIASGWDHCLALDVHGKLLSWGSGQNGKLGLGTEDNTAVPCYIPALENIKVLRFAAGCEHSAAVSEDGILYAWGQGDGGRLGLGTNSPSLVPVEVKPISIMGLKPTFIHCGDKFTIVIAKALLERKTNPNFLKLDSIQDIKPVKLFSFLSQFESDVSNETLKDSTLSYVVADFHSLIQQLEKKEILSPLDFSHYIDNTISMLLYSMNIMITHRLNDNLREGGELNEDVEYSLECCEDTFYCLDSLIDLLHTKLIAAIHNIVANYNAEHLSEGTVELHSNYRYLFRFLLQVILLTAANIDLLAKCLSDDQDREINMDFVQRFCEDINEGTVGSFRSPGLQSSLNRALSEDESSDDALSYYQHPHHRDRVGEDDRSQHEEGDVDAERSVDGSIGFETNYQKTESGNFGSSKRSIGIDSQEQQADVNQYHEPHRTLSPAPSYESLQNSTSGNENDDGIMEEEKDYYELQSEEELNNYFAGNEAESVELQHALLSSIGSSFHLEKELKYLREVKFRRGGAYLTSIKESICNLAASIHLTIIQCSTTSVEDMQWTDAGEDLAYFITSMHLVWESVQMTLTKGFEVMFGMEERKSLLLRIIRSPTPYLHIIPGIVQGMVKTNCLSTVISELMQEDSFFDTIDLPDDEDINNSPTLNFSDLFRFSKLVQQLFQGRPVVEMDGKVKTLGENLQRRVLSNLSLILLHLLESPLQWYRKYSSNDIERTSDGYLNPWGAQMTSLIPILTDCLLLDMQYTFSKTKRNEVANAGSTFSSVLLCKLFLSKDVNTEWSVPETSFLIPIALNVLSHLTRLGSENAVCTELFTLYFETLVRFLAHVVVYLSNPPLLWSPLLSRNYKAVVMQSVLVDEVDMQLLKDSLSDWECLIWFGWMEKTQDAIDLPVSIIQVESQRKNLFFKLSDKERCYFGKRLLDLIASLGVFGKPYASEKTIVVHDQVAILLTQRDACTVDVKSDFEFHFQCYLLFLQIAISSLPNIDSTYIINLVLNSEAELSFNLVGMDQVTSASMQSIILVSVLCQKLQQTNNAKSISRDFASRLRTIAKNMQQLKVYSDKEDGFQDIIQRFLIDSQKAKEDLVIKINNFANKILDELQTVAEEETKGILGLVWNENYNDSVKLKNNSSPKFCPGVVLIYLLLRQLDEQDFLQGLYAEEVKRRSLYSSANLMVWIAKQLDSLPKARHRFYEELLKDDAQRSFDSLKDPLLTFPSSTSETVFNFVEDLIQFITKTTSSAVEQHLQDLKKLETLLRNHEQTLTSQEIALQVKSILTNFRKAALKDIVLIDVAKHLLSNSSKAQHRPMRIEYWTGLFDKLSAILNVCSEALITYCEEANYSKPHSFLLLSEFSETVYLLERVLEIFLNGKVFSLLSQFSPDTKAFTSVLNIYRPLEYSLRALVDNIQGHFWFGKNIGFQYLCPKTMVLDTCSPTVSAGVCAPQGNFCLAFWLYIPNDELSLNQWKNNERIHILSRVPETGDLNTLDLLHNNLCDIESYTLSVHVQRDSLTGVLYLELSIITYLLEKVEGSRMRQNTSHRKRTIKRFNVRSEPLEGDKWVHCLLRIEQTSTQEKTVTDLLASTLDQSDDAVSTTIQLEIDRKQHIERKLEGGYWPLHQNVIIGKIPLGLGHAENRDNEEDSNIFIKVSDVVWLPTSLESTVPTENIFASFPPSEIVETLNSLFRGSCLLTKVVDSILATTPTLASESRAFSSTLLNNVSKLLKTAQTFLVVGCKNTQKTFLWLLQRLFKLFPELYTTGNNPLGSATVDVSMYLEGSPLTPAGSARSAAIRNKPAHATFTTLRLLVDMVCALMNSNSYPSNNDMTTNKDLASSFMSLKKIWDRRLYLNRINVETFMNITSWLAQYYVEENAFFQEVVNIFCAVKKNWKVSIESLFTELFHEDIDEGFLSMPVEISRKVFNILHFACHGGWFPSVRTGSIVDLIPRRSLLFYHNKLPIDQIAYPSTAVAIVENQQGSGNIVWLKNCEGLCQSINIKLSGKNVCFPNPENLVMASTELIPTQDADITHQHRDKTSFELLHVPISKAKLMESLSSILTLVKQNEATKEKDRIPKVLGMEEHVMEKDSTVNSPAVVRFLDLLQLLAKLRSISVLLCEQYATGKGIETLTDDEVFKVEVFQHLENIMTIAALEPTEAAAAVFESSSFKGIQVDVLRNLLKEGDIYFLEKLSTKMWKQFKFEDQNSFASKFVGYAENSIQMTALAGEVIINGSKVRAASHFPSVRLTGVGLERMTGRWFYECTLLSDGLMQIGWANSLFRCDPVCGQGVGDHVHSWAFDGLRTKKWNVSCEAYGRRWRLGDTVGVLVDMDLLEMRFYLNGEDLGPAFEDFASYEIFPALSLNVRQSVRLNFGQYRFLHPPSEVDGKPFRPVLLALLDKKSTVTTKTSKTSQGEDEGSKNVSEYMKRLQESKDNTSEGKLADIELERFGASIDHTNGVVEESNNLVTPRRATSSAVRSEVMSPVDEAVNYLAALRSARDNNQDRDNSNKHSDEEGSERGDRYNSEEEDDEEATESGDQNYVLNSRWQEDLEARIRMEAEENEDYEVDEEEGQDDEEEEEGGEGSNHEEAEEEEEEENSHLVELRRQAMIENLIGMGFPVDWALRAAEHCEVSTSESAAISWIIERMEVEQSKMNEIDGDSSRAGDGEDYDELESSGIDYLIQRQANAYSSQAGSSSSAAPASARGMSSSAAANRRLVAEHMMELLDSANVESLNPSTNPLTTLSPGSPTRGESFGLRRGLAYAALGMMMNDENAYSALVSSKLGGKKSKGESTALSSDLAMKDIESFDIAFFDAVPWNEEPGFSPILPGTYTTKRRHDNDKQEVLTQVSELDVFDMVPIVATCQFALCVYYARNIFLRLVQISRGWAGSALSPRKFALASKLLPVATEPSIIFKLLRNTFKQHVVSRNYSDRLFPLTIFGNSGGDMIEKLPPISPFLSGKKISFMDSLYRLELGSYRKSLNTIATEDYSIIGMLDLSAFVQLLVEHSTPRNSLLKVDNSKPDAATNQQSSDSSSISSSLSALQDRILQRAGVNTSELPNGQDFDGGKFSMLCNSAISTSVESCMATLERATATKFESTDWISNSMEKTNSLENIKSSALSALEGGEVGSIPAVLFAFWLLKCILTAAPHYFHMSDIFNPSTGVGILTSAEFLTKLLKLSTSMNDSLRFCLYELCSHILSLVNEQMLQVQLQDDSNRQQAALTQIAAAEYYVSVAKEKRLLQSFGNRIKVESNEKLLHSKYTRSIGGFLFQWYMLRRQLNISTFAYLQEYKFSNLSLHAKLDPEETVKIIKVCQISSSSVTVCWMIPSAANNLMFCFSMYITALSYMGMESPILVMANMDEKGTFRIDDLEPDTLYKVSIRKFKRELIPPLNPEGHEEQGYVILSTEGEDTFGFQAESLSPHLVISASNPLTLKNVANKKWSTARANVRLSSGVHRWDVHIDRCVSKNIFIGVATREARLDNYVGCDSYGWAFLANKAVWHNKSKVKAYGELFKTGDTVSVILDLDLGTLSFCLNDRPLGVAMDGLVGPLYPAFSLYNEDDQVTIAQVRSMQDNPSSFGSFAAENILDRTEILRSLMQYLASFEDNLVDDSTGISRVKTQRSNIHLIFQDEVLGEILLRWKLWQSNITVRTVASNGNIVTVQSCNESCKEFSQGKLEVGDMVVVEKRFAKIVGVGAHRIWLRVEIDGELMAFTQDSLQNMFEKNLISVASRSQMFADEISTRINCMHCIDESKLKAGQKEDILKSINSFKVVADLRNYLATVESNWTSAQDVTLAAIINLLAKKASKDCFSLGMSTLLLNLDILRKDPSTLSNDVNNMLLQHTNQDILLRILLLNTMNDLLVPLFPLVMPYWMPDESTTIFEATSNHPTLLLKKLRNLIFPSVKEQFALYMTYYSAKSYREMTIQIQAYLTSTEQPESPDQGALDSNSELLQPSTKQFGDVSPSLSVTSSIRESAINHATPTTFQSLTAPPSVLKEQLSLEKDTFKSKESSIAATPSPSSLLIPDKENNGDKSKFLLEVERQDDLALQILWAGHLHGVQNKVHEDETWNLFSRIQCTYAGQLMRYLELLKVRFGSALKAGDIPKNNNQTTHWSKSKDPSLWEHCFRMNCNNMLSVWNGDENLTAKQKSIPIYIRGIQYMVEQSSAKAAKASEELRIQFMLQRPQDSRKSFDRLFAVLFQFERNRELVSEWNLFSVFLEEACGQVQTLIDVLYSKSNTNQSLANRIQEAERRVKDKFSPAQLSLVLQLFYSTGVLIGLGFRAGASPVLDLPPPFYHVMTSTSLVEPSLLREDFLVASANAIRAGICSVYPEVALDLLTCTEFRNMISGNNSFGVVSPAQLYRSASYDAPLSAADLHLQFFWICLYELSGEQLRVLMRGCNFRIRPKIISALNIDQDDILFGGGQQYIKGNSSELRLRFMKPTAAAHLNADSTEITLFPDLAAISIPKYSSLKVTQTYVHQLIKSLQME